jgi:hypothetical protein
VSEATEVVRFKLKDGTTVQQLQELRVPMAQEYDDAFGGRFQARLYALEDGTFVDVWTWESRELAEAALADTSKTPSFEKWKTLVDIVSFDWATPASWGGHGR